MRKQASWMWAAALAAVLLMPTAASIGGAGAEGADCFIIEHSAPESAKLLLSRGYDVMETYDAFTLARLTPGQVADVERAGMRACPNSARSRIIVGSYDFDSSSEPRLPCGLRLDACPAGDGLYLVQLVGPARGEWLDELASAGASVINSVPLNSLLVSMDCGAARSVGGLRFVERVLIHQPAYKLAPDIADGPVMATVPLGAEDALASLSSWGSVLSVQRSESMGLAQALVEPFGSGSIEGIARIPMVMRVESGLVPDVQQQHSETESEIVGGMWASQTPYSTHGSYVNLQGWDGSGVAVSVCDGGIGNGNSGHPDYQARFLGGYHYWRDARNTDGYLAACSIQSICSHGVHMAGLIGGNGYLGTGVQYPTTTNSQRYYVGTGVAPNCTMYMQRLFTEGNYAWSTETYPNWEGFFNDSHTLGIDVCACSFGLTEGAYSLRSSAFDHAIRDCALGVPGDQPVSVTCSVGNGGPSKKCTEPSTAKNLMAVGGTETCYPDATAHSGGDAEASDNPDQLYTGSQSGTSDNRLKPDCVAPAQTTLSTASQFDGSSYLDGRNYFDGTADFRYYWNIGTSFSSPIGAGSLAVAYQYFKARYGVEPSPAMAKAMILNSCKDVSGTTHGAADIPNYLEGWGRIYLPEALTPTAPVLRLDRAANLQTGQAFYRNVTCDSTSKALKITMAYTDYQGAAGAAKALVNDISLKVTAPNAAVFYGNGFTNGWSAAGTYAGNTNYGYDWDDDNNGYDDHNNVEAVFIASPIAGTYRIEVIANSVVSDSVSATAAADQDFALVCWNVQGGDADTSPPAFAGAKAAECPGAGTSIAVTWDAASDWSKPVTYLVYRFDHAPTSAEVNASASIWTGTLLSFSDGTVAKGSAYWYVVRAQDSAGNREYNAVSRSCAADPVKYLQVQAPFAGYRGLNLDAFEATAQTGATAAISATGEHLVDSASGKWVSDVYAVNTDLSGTWTFRAYGSMANRYTTGYLYATVKKYSDGSVLFTTGYDDENVAKFTSGFHLFEWTYPASGVTIPAGDRYYVEYRVHATAVPGATLLKTYDYSSGTHTASYLDSEDTPPYDVGTTGSVTLSQIAASEDTRSLSRDVGSIDFVSLQCRMYLAETAAQIDEIAVSWEGKNNDADSNWVAPVDDAGVLALYAWNFATSKWLPVCRDGLSRTTEKVIAGTLNSDTPGFTSWTDFIGASNEFRWIASYKVSDMTMLTDYVKITVSRSSAPGAFTIAYDNSAAPSSVRHPEVPGGGPAPMPYDIDLTGRAANSWVFVSYPITLSGSITTILNDATVWGDGGTMWSVAKWYSPLTPGDPWKTYRALGTANDMPAINDTMGFWLYITANGGDQQLTTGNEGIYPSGTVNINLHPGWNMVGYPSATPRLASATLPAQADIVSVYAGSAVYNDYTDKSLVTMQAGRGYFVRATAACTWTVAP